MNFIPAPGSKGLDQSKGVSRLRPFARREESTFRPPSVAMRARNPCLRARTIFDGWNVLFIFASLFGGHYTGWRAKVNTKYGRTSGHCRYFRNLPLLSAAKRVILVRVSGLGTGEFIRALCMQC
jgi:hypothetical protein